MELLASNYQLQLNMKKIYLLFAAIAFLSSCSDDNQSSSVAPVQLELNVNELSFDKSGGVLGDVTEVSVKSNAEWTLVGGTSWCTPSVQSGKNDGKITFQAKANESNESRSYTYALVSGSTTLKLLVQQAAGGLLKPVQREFMIGLSGGNIRIPIENNVDYTYEIAASARSWITPSTSSTRAQANFPLSFLRFDVSAAPSNLNRAREGIITLKSSEAKDVEVRIIQERQPFVLQKDYYQVEPAGGTIQVQLDTDLDYEIKIADDSKDWISLSTQSNNPAGSQTITKEFVIRPTQYLRSGKIIFRSPSKDYEVVIDQAGSIHKFVDINNEPLRNELLKQNYIALSQERYEMTQKGVLATSMNLMNSSLTSLDGLELFESLTSLDCSNNSLVNVDFSPLRRLTQLKLSGNAWAVINLGSLNIRELTFAANSGLTKGGSYWGETSQGCKIISTQLESVTANSISVPYLNLAECPSLRVCNSNSTSSWNPRFFARIILPLAVKTNPNFRSDISSRTTIEYQ